MIKVDVDIPDFCLPAQLPHGGSCHSSVFYGKLLTRLITQSDEFILVVLSSRSLSDSLKVRRLSSY